MAMEEVLSTPALLAIAEGVAAHLGQSYLTALVRSLHEAMDVSIAFLTEGLGTPPVRARTFAAWRDGEEAESIEYDLEGTPCRRVYGGNTVIIPCDVGEKFPREAGYEGYAGVPLRNLAGEVTGHLAVLSRTPMTDPAIVETVLRIYGVRAEAEIRRAELEAQREDLIAQLERANHRLDRQLAAARRANETKTQLISLAAHDMRSGLQSIMTRSEMIGSLLQGERDDGPERIRDCAAKSADAVERLTGLIDGIMDRARRDTEALPLELGPTNLVEVATRAISFNAEHATRKSIALVLEETAPPLLTADPDLLIEALDNYVSNAVKYSPLGTTVRVRITVDGDAVHLVVEDEGQGLTPFDIEKAFGRFETLSARPTGGETATGLGLSLVRAIAEAHGGTAWVRSKGKDKGARFGITLPRKPAA